MRIPAFITVRTYSKRLPKKCLLPFGDINVLEHIVRRAKYYNFDPIICTTVELVDNPIEEIALKEKVKYFRGSVHNKLQRWLDCCNKFNIYQFHTIDADDPFFDGEQVKKSFALLAKGYDVVYPTESSSNGGASVGFSLTKNAIAKACKLIKEDENTEMMWFYLEKINGLNSLKLEDDDLTKVRLTLDYEEDYWLLLTVQRILGNFASREDINNLFKRNPDFFKINWFRNKEWKKNQNEHKGNSQA